MPFIGEIRMVAGNYAPAGWKLCNGQPLLISEEETLFNVIGTTYGGDGEVDFNVPNLSGRLPLHPGNGYSFAIGGGVEAVTLTVNQLPSHTHVPLCNSAPGDDSSPTDDVWADAGLGNNLYTPLPPSQPTGGKLNPKILISATKGSDIFFISSKEKRASTR